MLFQYTWQAVIEERKTQTRRIVKPGQMISAAGTCVYQHHLYRIIYEVGRTYAVQPARTAKGIARIRITGLRCEDVRHIRREDVAAEGFSSRNDFFLTWLGMHDKAAQRGFMEDTDFLHNTTDIFLSERPAERYQAWVISFELFDAQSDGQN